MNLLSQALIFLVAAVVAVPVAKRLGLGSVLGYLVAGMMIGPFAFNLVGEVEDVLHFAEFGVVLLLFIIGLELQPARLWVMRRLVFGLGSAQVLLTSLVLALIGIALGLHWPTAFIVGIGLALSSTAFALQILAERNQLTAHHGRASFAILLLQDIAVIPALALIPVLPGAIAAGELGVFGAAKAAAIIALVVVGGRYLLRPVLRVIAATRIHELFTAMTLLIVVATSLAMQYAGLSMALGAFLAGVLLAESEYRHELEADIEPFKGLLLGLFFMAVGASVNLGLIPQQPLLIAGMVVGLVAVKATVLWLLGSLAGLQKTSALQMAILVSQGGEFAFVLFTAAVGANLLPRELSDQLILVVTLSMMTTPIIILAFDQVAPRFVRKDESPFDRIEDEDPRVIIAGFGRFGQIIARILRAKKIRFTALDSSPQQIDFVRHFGNKVYYGDATRLDLLRSAGADKAKVFVLAVDNSDDALQIARIVRQNFPHLQVFARARNRRHVYQFMNLGVQTIVRETFFSSLYLAEHVLHGLGFSHAEADSTVRRFRNHDEHVLLTNYENQHDEARLVDLAKQAAKDLEQLFEQDTDKD